MGGCYSTESVVIEDGYDAYGRPVRREIIREQGPVGYGYGYGPGYEYGPGMAMQEDMIMMQEENIMMQEQNIMMQEDMMFGPVW